MLDVSVLLYPAAMRLVHISLCTFILTIFSYLISCTHYILVLTHYIVVCADLTPAMCFTICAVWALSYITGAVHYCANVTLSVYTRMKKLMLRAMKWWTWKKVLAFAYVGMLIACAIPVAIDAAIIATNTFSWAAICEALAAIWLNNPILGVLFDIYVWMPITYYMWPHLLGDYLLYALLATIGATAQAGLMSVHTAAVYLLSIAVYRFLRIAGAAVLYDRCKVGVVCAIIAVVPLMWTSLWPRLLVIIGSYYILFHISFRAAILLVSLYPYIVSKNYTLRMRRLRRRVGGPNYRTILVLVALMLKEEPLLIAVACGGSYIISLLAITSPIKRQLSLTCIAEDSRSISPAVIGNRFCFIISFFESKEGGCGGFFRQTSIFTVSI